MSDLELDDGVTTRGPAGDASSGEHPLAVSVDVEDWYHVPAVTGSSFSRYPDVDAFFEDWEGAYDHLTAPTRRTLELFDDLGVTATFFVVADVVDNYPGLVEEIAERGHEIGCHGLHHESTIDADTKERRFTRREYRERIDAAKRKLEDATGREVVGFRAPGAYVGGWVLDVIEDLGFEYDSSVARNSLFNKTDGDLEGVETTPYVPRRGSLSPGGDRALLELPWPYWELGPVRIPTGGGPLVRLFGETIVKRGVLQSLERGASSFYFHPLDIARTDFPSVGTSWRRPGYWAFTGATAERRIRSILRRVGPDRCVSCRRALERWRSEYA